jgi:N-acetylneuraminic acid mutarotase
MPTSRSELAATARDGQIYVVVGLRGMAIEDAFEVYSPASDTWQAAADLPHPLHHAALAAAGGKIYLTGGFGDLAFSQTSDAIWVYDPQSDSWQQAANMPGPRGAHTVNNELLCPQITGLKWALSVF